MEWMTIKTLVETVGLPIAMILFFIWLEIKHRQREELREKVQLAEKRSMAERLAKIEDYQRDELQKLVTDNTVALKYHADASRQMVETSREHSQINRQLIVALRTRPCMLKDIDRIQSEIT